MHPLSMPATSRGRFLEMVSTISAENLSGSPIRTGSADEAGTASAKMAAKTSFRVLRMVRPSHFGEGAKRYGEAYAASPRASAAALRMAAMLAR